MTITVKYPLDLTGKSSTNLVIGEVHSLPVNQTRVFVPSYGPFYTASLIVRDAATGLPL